MKKKSTLLALCMVFCFCFLPACKDNTKKPVINSGAELEALIQTKVDSFYTVYERFDYDWIDFFENEFTNVFPDTPIRKISKDSTKALWKDLYNRYEVQLLERGDPSFITSQDMVISHNYFNEIFIHKESRDTIPNAGTYVIAWRRQPDNSWKIVFESVHNNP